MKKLFCLFLSVLAVCLAVVPTAVSAYEPNDDIKSKIAYLVTMDSNSTEIYSKHANQKTQPCSLTKIMTAAVALSKFDNPQNVKVKADYNAVHSLDGTYCTVYGIKAEDVYSLLDLIYIMMFTSANDAATVIASFVGDGSATEFIALMNDKAKELGCSNTNFENPTGIDDDAQFTTAKDMAKIVKYAMSLPVFSTVAKTTSYTIRGNSTHSKTSVQNDNPLLPSENTGNIFAYDYCTGVKTGYTITSGYCTAATASKDGTTYIAITFEGAIKNYSGSNYNSSLIDTLRLFRWAFSNFKIKEICSSNNVVATVPVKLSSDTDYVGLVPSETVTGLVPINVDPSTVIIEPVDMPESVQAPIKAGDYVCKAKVIHAGETLITIDLVAYEDVKSSAISYVLYIVKKVFTNVFTIIFLLLILTGGIGYFVYKQRNISRRKKNKLKAMENYKNQTKK